jgi:hypothetical protein
MKTLQDLFEIIAVAVERNGKYGDSHWFIDYSGHVNKLSVRYYLTGWKLDASPAKIDAYLNEDGIQAAYWFIKTNL